MFDNLKPENKDPKISIDDNIEPEKELNDDDLVKFDKPIIEETDRPAWHFTLQKAAKAESTQVEIYVNPENNKINISWANEQKADSEIYKLLNDFFLLMEV